MSFFCDNIERIAEGLEVREGAKYYIDKMLNAGHEIYLISNRVYPHYNNPYETTVNWLKKNNINYTKLVLTKTTNKSEECIKHGIDIMFDDVVSNCIKMKNSGINCYLVKTKYNNTSSGDLKFVSSWSQIYNEVCNLALEKLPKYHVVLDTDTNNEADDQFALTYLLKSKERIILDAVTIAPYSHENDVSIHEGINMSYEVCKDIFKLCNEDSSNMIFKGSTDYFRNGYVEENEAIKKMVEVITKNNKTYIVAIGAITNVAVLLKLYPNLKEKIQIIWLGGHSIMHSDNREYNFRQDVEAVKYVFDSGVKLKVIPCNGVASNLVTFIYELRHYLDDEKPLNKYLCNRFYNDGRHGITKRRVIWDISAVAYIVNPYWFEEKTVDTPSIREDLSYEFKKNDSKIDFITNLNQVGIYDDLFKKLGN